MGFTEYTSAMSGALLSVEDACRLIGVLIGVLPGGGEVTVRGAMTDSIRAWPGTDWRAVARLLRDPKEDAWKIADWLEAEVSDEERRIAFICGGSPG